MRRRPTLTTKLDGICPRVHTRRPPFSLKKGAGGSDDEMKVGKNENVQSSAIYLRKHTYRSVGLWECMFLLFLLCLIFSLFILTPLCRRGGRGTFAMRQKYPKAHSRGGESPLTAASNFIVLLNSLPHFDFMYRQSAPPLRIPTPPALRPRRYFILVGNFAPASFRMVMLLESLVLTHQRVGLFRVDHRYFINSPISLNFKLQIQTLQEFVSGDPPQDSQKQRYSQK